MRVRLINGSNNIYALYSILIQENKAIIDLPHPIQNYINMLGNLKEYDRKDLEYFKSLTTDLGWSQLQKQIRETGACLMKMNIKSTPPAPPTGIYYTFPPFSELDDIQRK